MDADEQVTPVERKWGVGIRARGLERCLEAEEILDLLKRGKRGRAYAQRMEHVVLCAECYTLLKELREVVAMSRARPSATGRRRIPWQWATATVMVVAALALYGIFAWVRSGSPRRAPVVVTPPPRMPFSGPTAPQQRPPTPPVAAGHSSTTGPLHKPKVATKPPHVGPPLTSPAGVKESPTIGPSTVEGRQPRVLRAPLQIAQAFPQRFSYRENRLLEGDTPVPDEIAARYLKSVPPNIDPALRAGQTHRAWLRAPEQGLLEVRPTLVWETDDPNLETVPRLKTEPRKPGRTAKAVELEYPTEGSNRKARPKMPLQTGVWYRLFIQVSPPAEEATRQVPSTYSFRLRVMTERERRDYEWAVQNRGRAPITSALVLEALRLYRQAVEVLPETSDDERVRELRHRLERLVKHVYEPAKDDD